MKKFLFILLIFPFSALAFNYLSPNVQSKQGFFSKLWECKWHISCYREKLGSFTTITSTDNINGFPTVYNANLTATMEVGTTSVASITTLTNLASIGTITTGIWNGTVIGVSYNGTGTTSPMSNYLILGNGSSGFKVVNTLGTSGQFLTSQGAGSPPQWTTGVIDTSLDYNFTGTTYIKNLNASSTAANPIKLNTVSYSTPSYQGASSTVLSNNGSGVLTHEPLYPIVKTIVPIPAYGATSTATTGNLGANTIGYVGLFNITASIVVNNITIKNYTSGGSDTYNLGIFSEDGGTRLINVTTGTVNTSNATTTTAVSAVTLIPGNYYFVVQPVTGGVSNVFYSWQAFNFALTGKENTGRLTGLSAGVMPTTITPANIVNNFAADLTAAIIFRLDN